MMTSIFATYSPFERNLLKKEFNELSIESSQINDISSINKSSFDRTNTTLVLPGPLRMKYFSELLRKYEKIIFLAYKGKNYETISDQIDLIKDYNLWDKRRLLNFLEEIYDFMNFPFPEDLMVPDLDKTEINESDLGKNVIEGDINIIEELFKYKTKYKNLKRREQDLSRIEDDYKQYRLEYENKKFRESNLLKSFSKKTKLPSRSLIKIYQSINHISIWKTGREKSKKILLIS
jgi:hypothetical protein